MDALTNLALTSVVTAPTPATSGTTLTVTTSTGGWFPAPPFYAVSWPSGSTPSIANAEIVRVTAMSGDNVTSMTRAQGGTSARAIAVGDQFMHVLTAEWVAQLLATDTGIVDFGGPIEDGTAQVTVATTVTGASPRVWVDPIATAAIGDHDPDDVAAEALTAYLIAYTPGSSATIAVAAPEGTWGRYGVAIAAV